MVDWNNRFFYKDCILIVTFLLSVKALEELPQNGNADDLDDRSPDVELPIYQQRDNFFT